MPLSAIQKKAVTLIGGEAKHILLVGGSRSGKTFIALRSLIIRALGASNSRHVVLRFRFSHVKNTIVLDTFPKVMAICFPEFAYHLDKSDWYAKFSNGSQIWFGGLDDKDRSDKILGAEFATIFLNECSQITSFARDTVMTRLAQKAVIDGTNKSLRLKIIYDCNPPTKAHWTYKMFVKKLKADGRTPLTNPDSYDLLVMNPKDNLENLPDDYLQELEGLPTTQRLRFLEGKFADIASGTLWNQELIEANRTTTVPDLRRVVVAVDPSGAGDQNNEKNDATGIVVCGKDAEGIGYILADHTIKGAPATWGRAAVAAYQEHMADKIVAEKNYGGEMVRHVIHSVNPDIKCDLVTATRGKEVRAEPISALTEQGKTKFVGVFEELEEELCSMVLGQSRTRSPNRADAMVWAMTELFPMKTTTVHVWKQLGA